MAPPFLNDDPPPAGGSVYASSVPPFSGMFVPKGASAGTTPAPSTPASGIAPAPRPAATATTAPPQPRHALSPLPAAAASLNLRRRLLLPALAVPATLVSLPPAAAAVLALLARLANATRGGRGSLPAIVAASTLILTSSWCMAQLGRGAIERHAPTEAAKKRALAQSAVALPFWSLVLSIAAVRGLAYFVGGFASLLSSGNDAMADGGGWVSWLWGFVATALFWSVKVAGACVGPALGWMVLSALVALRYAGPFCPIVRCSSAPLRTNPFDAAFQRLGRNFTSKTRFLDMIADGLDKLSAPSSAPAKNGTAKPGEKKVGVTKSSNNQRPMQPKTNNDVVAKLLSFLVSSSTARYSRPGLISIMVQVLVNAVGGHLFAQAFVLPQIVDEDGSVSNATVIIVWLSCLLVPVFQLFSSINEAELHYGYYSSVGGTLGVGGRRFQLMPVLVALAREAKEAVKRSFSRAIVPAPIIAATTIILWSHLGPLLLRDGGAFVINSPSSPAIVQSLVVSYLTVALLVTIMAVQDVLTRWAVCAPGLDVDVLMYQMATKTTPKGGDTVPSGSKLLAEDLFIQSILGDGEGVAKVIAPPGGKSQHAPFANHQEDEISRNEAACKEFSEWIQESSTTSSGKLSNDILRICLLESLGGGGSSGSQQFYFGDARHTAAVRKRLTLSAATASPGKQPIAVPVVRALCAFAGGLGDAMSQIYNPKDKNGKPVKKNKSAELWKLPPGSLNASEFAINAAARLVVMNSVNVDKDGRAFVDASKRHERLSLLLPCVLQSAYKLRCGVREYAKATASMYEVNLTTYNSDGKNDGLEVFISTKCADLCTVISTCNDASKMAMKTLMESGDHTLEDVLLRRKWQGGMQNWLVEISSS